MKLYIYILIGVMLASLVFAESYDDCGVYGICEYIEKVEINNNTILVNGSEIWLTNEGNMDNVVDLYSTLDNVYLNLSGTNANQNIDIYPYNLSLDSLEILHFDLNDPPFVPSVLRAALVIKSVDDDVIFTVNTSDREEDVLTLSPNVSYFRSEENRITLHDTQNKIILDTTLGGSSGTVEIRDNLSVVKNISVGESIKVKENINVIGHSIFNNRVNITGINGGGLHIAKGVNITFGDDPLGTSLDHNAYIYLNPNNNLTIKMATPDGFSTMDNPELTFYPYKLNSAFGGLWVPVMSHKNSFYEGISLNDHGLYLVDADNSSDADPMLVWAHPKIDAATETYIAMTYDHSEDELTFDDVGGVVHNFSYIHEGDVIFKKDNMNLYRGTGIDVWDTFDGSKWIFNASDYSILVDSNVEFLGNLTAYGNTGLTGNYTNGNCWTYYTGGIATSTNCSAA